MVAAEAAVSALTERLLAGDITYLTDPALPLDLLADPGWWKQARRACAKHVLLEVASAALGQRAAMADALERWAAAFVRRQGNCVPPREDDFWLPFRMVRRHASDRELLEQLNHAVSETWMHYPDPQYTHLWRAYLTAAQAISAATGGLTPELARAAEVLEAYP